MELRETRDTAKAALEAAEGEYREAEADVFDAMDEGVVRGAVKVDLGEPYGVVSFQQRETHYGRIYDEEAAIEYYENRAMLEEVSKPKFVKQRISEEVRERLDDGQPMPPGVDYYTRRYVSITRQK
jgi:hypothetical protein